MNPKKFAFRLILHCVQHVQIQAKVGIRSIVPKAMRLIVMKAMEYVVHSFGLFFALHDESLSLSLSLLFMHHKILLSLVSLKHESESVV